MMRLGLLLAFSLSLAACARFSAVTEIHADGTWTRESRFTSTNESGDVSESVEFSIRDDLSNYFRVEDRENWEQVVGTGMDEGYLALRRQAKPGEALSELTVLTKSGSPMVRNEATVRRLGEDRLEYRETLKWVGERPAAFRKPSPEMVSNVEALLPEDLENRGEVSEVVTQSLVRSYFRLLFGGSGQEPLMSQAMVHRDIALRRLQVRIQKAVLRDLEEELKTHPQADRWPKLVEQLVDFETIEMLAKNDDDESPSDDRLLIPLSFTAKLPGRIVETNGELDPVTGEIYWTLFAGSAAFEDVVLRAVCVDR